LIKNTSAYESCRVLTGEKSTPRLFRKKRFVSSSKVSNETAEEKQEEKPLSLSVTGKGVTGCEDFS
jgi:hypothetical protein